MTIETEKSKVTGLIDWSASSFCLDIDCICGNYVHCDAEKVEHMQCPHCLGIFRFMPEIQLHSSYVDTDRPLGTGDLQWKNSNMVIDAACRCGNQLSVRGYWQSTVRCQSCSVEYVCGYNVQLLPAAENFQGRFASPDFDD